MIKQNVRDAFDVELETALVDGAKAVKGILKDDEAADRDKIAAFSAIVGASGLKGQRAAEPTAPKGGLASLSGQAVEALVGAVAGLVRIAGGTLDPTVVKTAAERAMIAEVVTQELPHAPDVSVTVDLPPAPKIVVPQNPAYLDGLDTPRSIEIKRMRQG